MAISPPLTGRSTMQWMRRTVFAYVALVLFGVALVAALAMTKAGIVAEIDAGAIGMAAP
jgi:hypothetical protein